MVWSPGMAPHVTPPPLAGSESTSGARLQDLVVKARQGDHAAFEELVRVTYVDAYNLAYRLTGDEDDARDVVQDAYLRAFRGLKRFRGEAQFTTWLYRITANCAASSLGKRARHRHDVLEDDEDIVDLSARVDPAEQADRGAVRDRVKAALAELPPRLRAVVVLRDVYDLSHEAIATELGITESAAKVRLHRARRKLRERLYPIPGEDERDARHAV